MAVSGVVSLASTVQDNKKFSYGDVVRVDVAALGKIERLADTDHECLVHYTRATERRVKDKKTGGEKLFPCPSVGTFVSAIDSVQGGMRVLINFNL